MQRYKLTIEYDGTRFYGWQIQKEDPTVQKYIMDAAKSFTGQPCNIVTAGRTDAGVHALGQVAHIDLPREYEAFRVRDALNYYLMRYGVAIRILLAEPVDDAFNARFSAKRRHYMYRIINRQSPLALDQDRAWYVREALDIKRMEEAAGLFVGTHDFSSFRAAECQAYSPVKTLERADIEVVSQEEIRLHFSARSFLHHMVRNIVGTIKLVGGGKWKPEDIQSAFAAKERKAGGPTAPAQGLYFVKVDY